MLRAVEGFPSRAICILPLGIRHSGMMADASIEIVFVHVGVHPDPLLPENLVVLRAGQGSKKKQFQNIERQLALDDLDIAQNRGPGITGEADDVAGAGDGAVAAPLLQHLPVVGNLVLALLRRNEVVRIDVLQPDEDTTHAGGGRLLDEIRDLVAKRIDLNGKADVRAVAGAQLDQPVEQLLPITVTGEIVVRDKKSLDVLRVVGADNLFDIVCASKSAFAALHIDDRAEGALVRTAASEIHAGKRSGGAADVLS